MLPTGCGSSTHFSRRHLLKGLGIGAASWLTPLGESLARQSEKATTRSMPKSVIVLWLQGGPSQLETFDPHPGKSIAGGSKAIATALPEVQLGEGLPQTAELMGEFSLIRSLTSKEGDHERAIYNMKTGYRPDPTLVHPAIGSIICHQTLRNDQQVVEIPRHISILPGPFPSTGGYLGETFDAFKTADPKFPVPDMVKRVSDERYRMRLSDLENIVDREFARGRIRQPGVGVSVAQTMTDAALRMMDSEQLNAFDVNQESEATREPFGDTPFGRGCLAAVRLIERGVRCVEVTLQGWDTHANNHESHAELLKTLDPAFSSLLRELKKRETLQDTVVICGGEFGRTPTINPAGGRDHWPHGFSVALAGGGIGKGRVIGRTSPTPKLIDGRPELDLENPKPVEDLHATVLHLLGVDYSQEVQTPIGRPMKLSTGTVIDELLA